MFHFDAMFKSISSLLSFSIPTTQGHLNTHVIIDQWVSVNSHYLQMYLYVYMSSLIGQLSAYRLQYTNMYMYR